VVICLCFEFVFVFFLINILDLYLDLLIFVSKGKTVGLKPALKPTQKCPKPGQSRPKIGSKPKLKSGYTIAGYFIKITTSA